MKKYQLTLAFLAGVAVCMLFSSLYIRSLDERGKHLVAWNIYKGGFQTATGNYNVEIDESDEGFGFSTITHLYLVGKPSYVSITGHDYDNDGKWDRVFYCGGDNHKTNDGHESGCNSVLKTAKGWEFEPCPADEGRIKPFTAKDIDYAISELNAAMRQFYNPSSIVSHWRWNAKEKKAVEVYRRS